MDQYYKHVVGGRMQYTHVSVPDDQEQELPYGATKLTREAYEREVTEQQITLEQEADAARRRAQDAAEQEHAEQQEAVTVLADAGIPVDALAKLLPSLRTDTAKGA